MNNPHRPEMSTQRQIMLEDFKSACDDMGPYISREKSLFIIMDKFPSVIDKLNEKGVDGSGLYEDLGADVD